MEDETQEGRAVTFNEHGTAMLDRIDAQQERVPTLGLGEPGLVLRDLALARTHLEDALTRFNSAQYRIVGVWQRRDPEQVV